jgi:hypothetical protein
MLAAVEEVEVFRDIDTFDYPESPQPSRSKIAHDKSSWEPQRLTNGNWVCNHKCKDKSACKHLCCLDGLEKAPKAPRSSTALNESNTVSASRSTAERSTTLATNPRHSKSFRMVEIETIDLSSEDFSQDIMQSKKVPHTLTSLRQSKLSKEAKPCKDNHIQSQLPHLNQADAKENAPDDSSTEFEADWAEDLPSPSLLIKQYSGQSASRGIDGDCRAVRASTNDAPSIGISRTLESYSLPASPAGSISLAVPYKADLDPESLPGDISDDFFSPSLETERLGAGLTPANAEVHISSLDNHTNNSSKRSFSQVASACHPKLTMGNTQYLDSKKDSEDLPTSKRQKHSTPERLALPKSNNDDTSKAGTDLRHLFP